MCHNERRRGTCCVTVAEAHLHILKTEIDVILLDSDKLVGCDRTKEHT